LGVLSQRIDVARTLRGAACGSLAAAIWAAQQPFDKRLFGCAYDDVELLGRAVWRGEAWYPAGLLLHIENGALFGAIYANLAPLVPLPAVARGAMFALGEHLATWQLTGLTDRFHPARRELPLLAGSRRAFAQATWRHLLFGALLGELERRLNRTAAEVPLEREPDYSSNGHGSIEHAVSAGHAE
jgi:hypothetical protein